MSNFWMVQFKKNESEPISVIRTSLKLGIIFTNVHINIQLIRTIKRCVLRFGVLGGGRNTTGQLACSRLCRQCDLFWDTELESCLCTGHWWHGRQCAERLLQHPTQRSSRSTSDVVDVLQSAEAAELPEEKHTSRETAIFYHEQHWLWAVLASVVACCWLTVLWMGAVVGMLLLLVGRH